MGTQPARAPSRTRPAPGKCYHRPMQLQMSLIRQILASLESSQDPWAQPRTPSYDKRVVDYHVDLCEQAGFIRRRDGSRMVQLTWTGHIKLAELNASARRN